MNWSHFQTDIYEAFEHGSDSLLIEAVAGSGKTTVLVELSRIMQRAMPQQRGVFLAFNKSIAMELQSRIDARNVQAMTLHSAGWSAWRRAGGLDWTPQLDTLKTVKIMREVLSYEENKRFGETTRRLVGYAKGCGLIPSPCYSDGSGYQGLIADTDESWEGLIDHYSLDEDACNIQLARRVLYRSIELAKDTCDFDDMLLMPVIAGVEFDRWDVVLVDEAQDVSGIQMEMISRMVEPRIMNAERRTGRVIAVGDRAQAIYGFRGAGTTSMDELQRRFHMTELPLSVSYRCPIAVVQHARQWVSQIEWREDAEDGYVGLEGTDWSGQAGVALGAPLDTKPRFATAYGVSPEKYRDMAGGSDMSVEEAEGLLETFERSFPNAAAGFMHKAGCPAVVVGEWPHDKSKCTCNFDRVSEGITKWRGISDFQPGDAILCRLTRPLVAAAFTLIRNRIACRVLGRDIAAGLVAIVKKGEKSLKYGSITAFGSWLDDYERREGERLRNKGRHAQAGLLGDKCDTIRVFMERFPTDAHPLPRIPELIADIERLFVDNSGATGMVTLATVHKSKGLQWSRVFILDAGDLMPCPWARGSGWEMQQEKNLQYVAATRTMKELRYITTKDLGGR